MKKALSFVLIVIATITSSCNKCETCSHTFKLGGVDSTVSYPQTCGNKKDIEKYEQVVRADAAINGSVVTCIAPDTK